VNDLPLWRERFLSRYGKPRTTSERIGFVLASVCDERGVVWISAEAVRLRMIAIWPELLKAEARAHGGRVLAMFPLNDQLEFCSRWSNPCFSGAAP
jgi:hypothetical protein